MAFFALPESFFGIVAERRMSKSPLPRSVATPLPRKRRVSSVPVMGGTYMDTFVKHEGVWLFARKQLVHNIVGDMALKNKQ